MTDPGLDAARRAFVAGARTATLVTIGPDGTAAAGADLLRPGPDAAVLFTPIDEKPKRTDDPHDLARRPRHRGATGGRRPRRSLGRGLDEAGLGPLPRSSVDAGARARPGTPSAVEALRAKYPQYATTGSRSGRSIRVDLERVLSWGALGD